MGHHTKAELIDTKTNEIKELFCRSDNRRCDFMDEFSFGRFYITLRLDWGDLDENFQEPTLDADVYVFDEKTKKKKKKKYKSNKKEWHHTEIEKIPGEKFKYRFSFYELELIFERRITTENILNGKIKIINTRN